MNRTSAAKNSHGNVVNPRSWATGDTVSATPMTTTATAATVNTRPGLLRTNGTRRVRIAKMISVWVASDSTNQPVRNSTGPACSAPSINPNVRKSNSELMGPNVSMNRRMNAMFQCDGASNCSLSTRSVGIANWELS